MPAAAAHFKQLAIADAHRLNRELQDIKTKQSQIEAQLRAAHLRNERLALFTVSLRSTGTCNAPVAGSTAKRNRR